MSKRMFLRDADSKAFAVLMGFEKYLAESSLDKIHAHLIKIRVSQLNGCSYCIDKHAQEALAIGETGRRLFLLTCWRETPFFTPEERAILALTEEMTLLSPHGVADGTYDAVLALLGQQYTTEVMMAIIAMNAWNRVGIATNRRPV
ncbi:MAG TPA: carboxymuconolactone decarboxylase family protein [Puia sp.]|nr:carboxymuconolactone decarboxylase family protein [Puia sp.]